MSDIIPFWPVVIGFICRILIWLLRDPKIDKYAYSVFGLLLKIINILILVNLLCLFLIGELHYQPVIWFLQCSFHKSGLLVVDGVLIASWIVSLFPNERFAVENTASELARINRNLAIILSAYFLFTGLGKIMGHAAILQFFNSSGYNVNFLNVIIGIELCCSAGLLFIKTRPIAALILFCEMLGAAFTHYRNFFVYHTPDPFSNAIDTLRLLPLLLAIILYHKRPLK